MESTPRRRGHTPRHLEESQTSDGLAAQPKTAQFGTKCNPISIDEDEGSTQDPKPVITNKEKSKRLTNTQNVPGPSKTKATINRVSSIDSDSSIIELKGVGLRSLETQDSSHDSENMETQFPANDSDSTTREPPQKIRKTAQTFQWEGDTQQSISENQRTSKQVSTGNDESHDSGTHTSRRTSHQITIHKEETFALKSPRWMCKINDEWLPVGGNIRSEPFVVSGFYSYSHCRGGWTKKDEDNLWKGWTLEDERLLDTVDLDEFLLWRTVRDMFECIPAAILPPDTYVQRSKTEHRRVTIKEGLETNLEARYWGEEFCDLLLSLIECSPFGGNLPFLRYVVSYAMALRTGSEKPQNPIKDIPDVFKQLQNACQLAGLQPLSEEYSAVVKKEFGHPISPYTDFVQYLEDQVFESAEPSQDPAEIRAVDLYNIRQVWNTIYTRRSGGRIPKIFRDARSYASTHDESLKFMPDAEKYDIRIWVMDCRRKQAMIDRRVKLS